jgi:hypothetical protein
MRRRRKLGDVGNARIVDRVRVAGGGRAEGGTMGGGGGHGEPLGEGKLAIKQDITAASDFRASLAGAGAATQDGIPATAAGRRYAKSLPRALRIP